MTTSGFPCPRPGCSGTVDDTGYCDRCGEKPAPRPTPELSPSALSTAISSYPSSEQLAGGLVELPPLPEPDPDSLVLSPEQAVVPERHRHCAECGRPVGRSRGDRAGLTSGFCPDDGTPFSFVPSLTAGEALGGGRYEVLGPIAHGGVNWVYLAKDTALEDRRVVLKGLINPGDPNASLASVAERRYLIVLDHRNIVRILDFTSHPDPGTGAVADYIVMEFVGGKTLQQVKREALTGGQAMPVDNVIAYGLAVLGAFDYLHGRGYLYCDLKPDNVIHGGHRVRLIDLGAMRAITDRTSPTWGARLFRVSDEEIGDNGLTVQSDLYSVGKTLRSLFDGSGDLPRLMVDPAPIAAGIDSFQKVLDRATSPDWNARFDSAADMAGQLVGALRQIKSLRAETVPPEPSRCFNPPGELLDAGLGTVPGLDRWTTEPANPTILATGVPMADGRPDAGSVAVGLPEPLTDRNDPAAADLGAVSASNPLRLLDELAKLGHTVETALWRCRAHLALPDLLGAREDLAAARTIANGRPNWRIDWHAALLALADDNLSAARTAFESVHLAVPGELPPRLALGFCAESAGDRTTAKEHYRTVWHTDRTQVSAAFGLVRLALRESERDEAVRILDEVPRLSRHYDSAQIAAVQARIGNFPGAEAPFGNDLLDAGRRWEDLAADEAARQRLAALLQQAAVPRATEPNWANTRPSDAVLVDLFGSPITEAGIRARFESSLRELTRQARNPNQHGTLTDLANTVRTRSLTWKGAR
ncbi:MAG TPA: tetratricopeptide repeat protein [Pseudonocardiaceae bacterium]|nr:tetratricopeptide repeat protein [Pseudonocardiaceae bacterium]